MILLLSFLCYSFFIGRQTHLQMVEHLRSVELDLPSYWSPVPPADGWASTFPGVGPSFILVARPTCRWLSVYIPWTFLHIGRPTYLQMVEHLCSVELDLPSYWSSVPPADGGASTFPGVGPSFRFLPNLKERVWEKFNVIFYLINWYQRKLRYQRET